MIIISHRGYWYKSAEKNTATAFQRSFDLGFGTETDIRDSLGSLVISHDMPLGGEMTLDQFFSLRGASHLPLALNIKADGLADRVLEAATRFKIKDWFVFDMAIPDMRAYLKAGCPVFCRMSEVELTPAWLAASQGVWLDSFESEWYDNDTIADLLKTDKRVCIVSSELHGRSPDKLWKSLREFRSAENVILCTDLPEKAKLEIFQRNE